MYIPSNGGGGKRFHAYTFDETSVRKRAPTHRNPNRMIDIAHFGVELVARVLVASSDGQRIDYRFRFTRTDRDPIEATFGTAELADGLALRRRLAEIDPGLVVEAGQHDALRAAFGILVANAVGAPIEHAADVTGWVRGRGERSIFATREGAIGGLCAIMARDPHQTDLGGAPSPGAIAPAGLLRGVASINDARTKLWFELALLSPLLLRQIDGDRAPLFFVLGPTGSGKSVLLDVIAGTYSRSDRRVLSAASTGLSLERALSVAGDQPVCIDDLKRGTASDADVLRLIQSNGDGQHRQRLRSDAEIGRTWPPRGTLVLAGEDFIEAERSAVGRLITVQLHGGEIDPPALARDEETRCALRATVRAYIEWLADRFAEQRGSARKAYDWLRPQLATLVPNPPHPRMFENVARALAAFAPFLAFAGLSGAEQAEYVRWQLVTAADLIEQARGFADEARLGRIFINDLRGLWTAGRVSIEGVTGGRDNADLLGVIRGGVLYVQPEVAERLVLPLWNSGRRSRWSIQAVGGALEAEGFLAHRDKGQRTTKVEINGARVRAWAIRADAFFGRDTP